MAQSAESGYAEIDVEDWIEVGDIDNPPSVECVREWVSGKIEECKAIGEICLTDVNQWLQGDNPPAVEGLFSTLALVGKWEASNKGEFPETMLSVFINQFRTWRRTIRDPHRTEDEDIDERIRLDLMYEKLQCVLLYHEIADRSRGYSPVQRAAVHRKI